VLHRSENEVANKSALRIRGGSAGSVTGRDGRFASYLASGKSLREPDGRGCIMNNNIKAINKMSSLQSYAESTSEEMSSATKLGFEKTISAINNSVSAAGLGFEKTQAQVKQNMDKVMKTTEELVSFSQGNYDAFVKSSQIWAAGIQDLTKQIAANAQAQFDETVAAMKSFGSVKSLKEVFDMQTSLARSSMEKAMTESGRLTDASIKLAEQAMAPLTARVNLAVEKFGKAV